MIMANKQTSSKVSEIAARLVSMDDDEMFDLLATTTEDFEHFCRDVRSVAASALSQDEVKGEAVIPNPIIPSEPMRNAVTKTSETANVQDTALETEGNGQIASTDSATTGIDVHGEIDAEGLKAATHKIRSACYRFSSLQPDMEAWLESSAYSVIRAYLDATPAPEPQPEVAAEPVAWLKEWRDTFTGDDRKKVHLHDRVYGWMREYNPTVTPLYRAPSVVEEAVKAEREACAQQVLEYLAETISANDGNRQLMIKAGLPVNETDRRGHLLRTIRDDLSAAIRARSATP